VKQTTILASLLLSAQIAVFGQGAAAQNPDPKLQFEVASVKIAPPMVGNTRPALMGTHGGPGTADPGQYTLGYAPIKTILVQAFGVRALQISGPAWLDKADDRYDIVAKLPAGASKEDLKTMLQNLLVERFGMAFHRETKELPGYQLVVGKNGPKLKESEISADPPPAPAPPPAGQPFKIEMDRNGLPQLPPGRPGMLVGGGFGRNVIVARQQPISQLATFLENQLGKPVVDKTGLTAKYDYGFAFDATGLPGAINLPGAPAPAAQTAGPAAAPPAFDTAPASAPSLFNVVQQELGLRLDQKKVTVELIVVDRVERVPSEN
jgi:uncharacterized protein (TIGR03435 family)